MPQKYLYLTKHEWAETWLNGGEIPISLASSYLSQTREGTRTPDETRVYDLPVSEQTLLAHGIEVGNARNISITLHSDGELITQFRSRNTYTEDGLILSFCNVKSMPIMYRLGKVTCVEIRNIDGLRRLLDKQLGTRSQVGNCRYTMGHERDHFLKSTADSWQQEYRFFWPGTKPRVVVLPPGVARLVKV